MSKSGIAQGLPMHNVQIMQGLMSSIPTHLLQSVATLRLSNTQQLYNKGMLRIFRIRLRHRANDFKDG